MKPDNTDLKIIEQLEEDGRQSLRKIAEKIGVSPSTVSQRFQKMKEEDIIQGFRPELNYEKMGYELTAVIEIKANSNKTEKVENRLKNMDRVFSLYQVTGKTDTILICKFKDREDMNRHIKQFQKVEGVLETVTKVVITAPVERQELDLKELI